MPELSIIQQITVWAIPILLAITLHEAAHAWAAAKLGDSTAKMLGRLSFNPIKHIDLFGTILIPLAILVLSNFNFVFGWAKPVPINENNFKNPRQDIALSTAAGPIANLIMAFLWALCLKITIKFNLPAQSITLFLILVAKAGILINALLAFLNLLPIPPLDGSKILMSLLPVKQAQQYQKIEPYGFIIILLLLVSGILNLIISPLINGFLTILGYIFN